MDKGHFLYSSFVVNVSKEHSLISISLIETLFYFQISNLFNNDNILTNFLNKNYTNLLLNGLFQAFYQVQWAKEEMPHVDPSES